MNYWQGLIAVIFTVAVALGSSLSGALAAPVVAVVPVYEAVQGVDTACEVAPATVKSMVLRPCGKAKNGLAIPCHADWGVLVSAITCIASASREVVHAVIGGNSIPSDTGPPYRPPRAA